MSQDKYTVHPIIKPQYFPVQIPPYPSIKSYFIPMQKPSTPQYVNPLDPGIKIPACFYLYWSGNLETPESCCHCRTSQYVPVQDPSIFTLTGFPADSSSDGSSPYSCQQPIRASFSLVLLRLAEDVNRAAWFTCSSSRSWTPHGSRNLSAADDRSHSLIAHSVDVCKHHT